MAKPDLQSTLSGLSKNKRIAATVVEVFFGQVTVRVGGRLLPHLRLIGGTPTVGGTVYVDYASGVPVAYAVNSETQASALDNSTERMISPDLVMPGVSKGGHDLQDEGVQLPEEPAINFVGDGISATDNPATRAIDVTVVNMAPIEGPGIDLVGRIVGLGGDSILLFHANGDPVSERDATDAGLDAIGALVTSPYDRVEIPQNAALTNNHLLAACQYLFHPKAQVSCQLTLADETFVQSLRNLRTANNADSLFGIVGPANPGEVATLLDCESIATQAGSGTAAGLAIQGGQVRCWLCHFEGTSVSGPGNGVLQIGLTTITTIDGQFHSWEDFDNPHVEDSGLSGGGGGNPGLYNLGIPLDHQGTGNGDCAYIEGANGGGIAWVTYDLGGDFIINQFHYYMAYDGDTWCDLSPDGVNWTKNIVYMRTTWAAKGWGIAGSNNVGGGVYRYVRFKAQQLQLIGSNTSIGYFYLDGTGVTTTFTYGDIDLLYCQVHGSTTDINMDYGATARVYACQYDPASVLGTVAPTTGDRSAWEVSSYGSLHADDWDAGDSHHPVVTLDAEADGILDLNGQILGLDAQAANTILAGPPSGDPAAPAFRQVVAADLGTGMATEQSYLRGDLTWQRVGGGVLMQDGVAHPPVPVESEDGTDWLQSD